MTRAPQESAIYGAVKRQMDTVESQFKTQLSRHQAYCEKQFEDLATRAEDRSSASERHLKKFAELAGKVSGISNETQNQIRRFDRMEVSICDFRQHVEEDLRKRDEQFEQFKQKAESSSRTLSTKFEDGQKWLREGLKNLEKKFEEKMEVHEEALQSLQDQLDMMAGEKDGQLVSQELLDASRSGGDLALPRSTSHDGSDSHTAALIAVLEQRLTDLSRKWDELHNDTHSVHEQLHDHAERIRAHGTLLEMRDKHSSTVSPVVEQLQQGHTALRQSHERHAEELGDQLNALKRRLESHEQARQGKPAAEIMNGSAEEVLTRLEECEAQLEALGRLEGLVGPLKEIVPRVVEHQASIQQLMAHHEARSGKQSLVMADDDQHRQHLERTEALERRLENLSGTLSQKPVDSRHDMQAHSTENELMQARVEALASDVNSMVDRVYNLPQISNEPRQDVEDLQERLKSLTESLTSEMQELRGRVETLSPEHPALKELAKTADSRHEEHCKRLDSMHDRMETLSRELELLSARTQEERERPSDAHNVDGALSLEHPVLKTLAETVNTRHAEHCERADAMQHSVEKLSRELELLSSRLPHEEQARTSDSQDLLSTLSLEHPALKALGETAESRHIEHRERADALHDRVESLSRELQQLGSRTGELVQPRDLQELAGTLSRELPSLKAQAEATEARHLLHSEQVEDLQSKVKALSEELQRTQEISQSRGKSSVPDVASELGGSACPQQLADLIQAVRRDEQEEQLVHGRLSLRLEEMCDGLGTVVAALTREAN